MTYISTISPEEFARNLCENLYVNPTTFRYHLKLIEPEIHVLRDRVVAATNQIKGSSYSLSQDYIDIVNRLDTYRYSFDMECPYVQACLDQIKLNTLRLTIL